jgi:putative tricarboxylic transport membrane protein
MSDSESVKPSRVHFLRRIDVVAGFMFMSIAIIGLWASHDYPIGTATRMGTGYVPRLLCWILLGLGLAITGLGLRSSGLIELGRPIWRAIIFAPLSLLAFALLIGRFGVIVATVALVAVGALAGRESRPLEVALAAVFLVMLTLAIFVWGVGLPIPVWPEW